MEEATRRIIEVLGLSGEKVLNIYTYGSKVYGTASEKSDDDYIIVVEGNDGREESLTSARERIDATLYDVKRFEDEILAHEISVLECLFLPESLKVMESRKFECILDLPTLREAISSKASNSFVKAKKKFIVEKDFNPYIAKKSLWHSLRILKFGLQLATCGFIHDYRVANSLWESIRDCDSDNWEDYKKIYQPIYNEIKTAFRELAPKDEN